MSSPKLCVRCPKVGRDGLEGRPEPNIKYEKHSSYCKVCVREYNADRYRQASSLKDFFPGIQRRVYNLADQVARLSTKHLGDTDIELLVLNVSGLVQFLSDTEDKLPGKIAEKRAEHEERVDNKRTAAEARARLDALEFERILSVWESLRGQQRGIFYDNVIGQKPQWEQWFDHWQRTGEMP